jgi:tRNA A37 methylthiotransferase MiaB
MKGQVKPEVRKSRNHILRETLDKSEKSYREKFVSKTMSVLWESTSEMGEWGWQMEGLTPNYLRVRAFAPSPRWNELDDVQIERSDFEGLRGIICNK